MIQHIFLIAGIIGLGIWFLIKLKNDFSERLFFQIGMYLFLIQGLANVWTLVLIFNNLLFPEIIAKVFSIIFQFVIAYFFYWLSKKMPASMGGAGTQLNPEEIAEFMKGGEK